MQQNEIKKKALLEIKEQIERMQEDPHIFFPKEFTLQIDSTLELNRFTNLHIVQQNQAILPKKKQLSSMALSLIYS